MIVIFSSLEVDGWMLTRRCSLASDFGSDKIGCLYSTLPSTSTRSTPAGPFLEISRRWKVVSPCEFCPNCIWPEFRDPTCCMLMTPMCCVETIISSETSSLSTGWNAFIASRYRIVFPTVRFCGHELLLYLMRRLVPHSVKFISSATSFMIPKSSREFSISPI
jgi:hypothetical protein